MGVALHVPREHCLAPERAEASIGGGSRYGRMFDLPALEADERLLHELGAAGGFCDGGDCKEDERVEAGWPFFGQYVADPESYLAVEPDWSPTLPARGERFRLADLLVS